MHTSAQIDSFHKSLADELQGRVGFSGSIVPQIEKWKKIAAKGTKVFFSADGIGSQRSQPLRGNALLPTFPLLMSAQPSDGQLWWGWREEWRSEDVGRFVLVGVQFIFFWGNSVTREQVFRADWDEIAVRSSDVGQPHWHIDDRFLVVQSWSRLFKKTGFEEIEAPSLLGDAPDYDMIASETKSPDSILDMGGAHLFMGGWRNDRELPKCWQVKLDLKEIVHWAGRTLLYVRQEVATDRVSAES